MKSAEFYDTFKEYETSLKDVGFKKKSKNKYAYYNDIQFGIALDRWGWDDVYGWGFLVRMSDTYGIDIKNHEQPTKTIDLRYSTLIEHNLMTDAELDELYNDYKTSHPKFYEERLGLWYSFYDLKHLQKILTKVIPLIAQEAKDCANKWTLERIAT